MRNTPNTSSTSLNTLVQDANGPSTTAAPSRSFAPQHPYQQYPSSSRSPPQIRKSTNGGSTGSNTHGEQPSTSNFLSVTTLQPLPQSGSGSNSSLLSPNLLQGIVIESLKTPVQGAGEGTFDNDDNDDADPDDEDGDGASDKEAGKYAFGGHMFEPENSTSNAQGEDRGVAWMLYRQRSHSAGATPQTRKPTVVSSTSLTGLGANAVTATATKTRSHYHARSISASEQELPSSRVENSFRQVASNTANFSSPTRVNTEHTKQEDSYWTSSSETGVRGGYKRQQLHRPLAAHRHASNRTSSKIHSSAYRQRVFEVSNSQQQQYDNSAIATISTPALSVSTESLNTATRASRTMDGALSQHFFNRKVRTQQLRSQHTGRPMDASSPASTLFSNGTLSPTLSSHSASTAVSQTSTLMTDSSETSGSSRGSYYTSSSYEYVSSSGCESDMTNSPSVLSSPGGASTICEVSGQEQTQQQPQATSVRGFFERAFVISSNSASSSSPGSLDQDGYLQRPTLKELGSSRDTRYYGKSNSNLSSTAKQPQLSSSLYYITGLTDVRQARKRGGGRYNGKGGSDGSADPDSKAFFSNERTYLHWIKFGLLLGSMALTLLSFGESTGLQVGLFLVLVAMATLVYATATFHLRHKWMIQLRQDVKFYDRVGPTILFMALFLAYATNVVLTMDKFVGEFEDDEGYNFYRANDGSLDV